MAISPIFSLLLLSSLLIIATSTSPLPEAILNNAVETLSDAGYISMALTLQLTFQTLIPSSNSSSSLSAITVFSPSDEAFSTSGQPPLSLLRYHLSPAKLTLDSLRSLPFAAKIPTLLSSNRSLLVTTDPANAAVSLNGVEIDGSGPIYDDGSLVIYGTGEFFDPSFTISPPPSPATGGDRDSVCSAGRISPEYPVGSGAPAQMRSRGFSTMAAFLDLQLSRDSSSPMTVFAPEDSALGNCQGNFTEHVAVMRRHVVPCRLDLVGLGNLPAGTALPTFSEGFVISVGRSDGLLALNGVLVYVADMYSDEFLVVHGVRELLNAPIGPDQSAGSASVEFDTGGGDEHL